MARIILVDDQEGIRENKLEALKAAGHEVDPFFGDRVHQIQARLEHVLNSAPAGVRWDVLVLDLQFGPELYAGIDLYNNLQAGNYTRFWKHTIVYSKHVPGRPGQVTDGPALVVVKWAQGAQIPLDNLLNSSIGTREALCALVKELLKDMP